MHSLGHQQVHLCTAAQQPLWSCYHSDCQPAQCMFTIYLQMYITVKERLCHLTTCYQTCSSNNKPMTLVYIYMCQ